MLPIKIWLVSLCITSLYIQCGGGFDQQDSKQEKPPITANKLKKINHNNKRSHTKRSNQVPKKGESTVVKPVYASKKISDAPSNTLTSIGEPDPFAKQKPKLNQVIKKGASNAPQVVHTPKKSSAAAISPRFTGQAAFPSKQKSKKYTKKDNSHQVDLEKIEQKPHPKPSLGKHQPTKIKPSQVSAEDLKNLRAGINAAEEAGQLVKAAQEMDKLLKLVSTPTLEDLCYALDLNRRAPFMESSKNRPHQLAVHIAEHLQIDLQASTICFDSSYTWQQLWPYIDYLIAETAADPTYEKRKFKYKLEGQDLAEYIKWQSAHMTSYRYPISISGKGCGAEGNKSAEGVWDIYHKKIIIHNYTQKEKQASEVFAYHFHGGRLDTDRMNLKTFYNLMVRAGFEEEDFAEGKYGFQDKVLVKPILLNGATLEECDKELRASVKSSLEKAPHPYIALIFSLQSGSAFNINDLYIYKDNHLDDLGRYFFNEFGAPLATTIEPEENRLYLCFYNGAQNILDLHATSAGEAFSKLHAFILERYNNFESECTVITGRGNHINSNGEAGILHKAFKGWAKNKLKRYIKAYSPMGKNGGYKITLQEPIKLTLANQPPAFNIQQITLTILRANQTSNKRVAITHEQPQPEIYYTSLFVKAMQQLNQVHGLSVEFQVKYIDNGICLSWGKDINLAL